MGILWYVSTAAPVCSYGIKKAGWYAWRAIRWIVAQWLHACHDAGIEVRVQVNESVTT
ncbi:putative ydeA protein [Escherichia coli 1-182-04_S4_C1]|uniref:Uncharacterized protein n=1 Tax=Escherichia coli TaxID=562 RepID=Q08JR3_ECOLX|nr:putative ydeA protein [Escherichia coli 1-182-04_S4_C1]BAF33874.1 hypothetical protein [Escherichia coli]